MFEDIYPPQNDDEKIEKRHKSSKTRFRTNLNQAVPKVKKQAMWSGDQVKTTNSLTEQIKLMTDLRQLVKILEIAKVKVCKEKLKQRKIRKKNRKIKY